jgi:hypothetical protein
MERRATVLIALILASAVVAAQNLTPTPTGLIVGRLVAAGGGSAPAGVIVAISGSGIPTRRVIVDSMGRFFFGGLPAGSFTLTTSKTGYIDGAYGKNRPDGQGHPVTLQEGERLTDLAIKMWRYATISGTVTDDLGDPVRRARIQVLRRTLLAGRWQLVNSNIGADSDDRGQYRVTQLVPGDYAVVITSFISAFPAGLMEAAVAARQSDTGADTMRVATTNGTAGVFNDVIQGFPATRVGNMLVQTSSAAIVNETIRIYPTAWYADAATPAQASLVTLGPGDDRVGIDLRLTLTPSVSVSGHVTGAEGAVPLLSLRLVPTTLDEVSAEITSSLALSFTTSMTATDPNGDFTFVGVPPGSYVIRGLTSPPRVPIAPTAGERPVLLVSRDPAQWTATPVTVGSTPLTGVSVQLQPGLRVTGRVEFDGTAPRPTSAELRAIRTQLDPADGRTIGGPGIYQAQVDADATLYTTGVVAGRYVLRVDGVPRPWSVKSAIVNGVDILDQPIALEARDVGGLVLTLTDRPSGLSGTVRNAQGQLDESADVVVFPRGGDWTNHGPTPRRFRLLSTNRVGAFAAVGLPAGDYYVVAVSGEATGAWQSSEMLQRLARVATSVTVGDHQNAAVSLTRMEIR